MRFAAARLFVRASVREKRIDGLPNQSESRMQCVFSLTLGEVYSQHQFIIFIRNALENGRKWSKIGKTTTKKKRLKASSIQLIHFSGSFYSLFLFGIDGKSASVINHIQLGLMVKCCSGCFVISGAPEDSEAGGRRFGRDGRVSASAL